MSTLAEKPPIRADSLVLEIDITRERMKQALLFAVKSGVGLLLVRDSMLSDLEVLAHAINREQSQVSVDELQDANDTDPASLLAKVAAAKSKKVIELVHTPVSAIEKPSVAVAIIKIYDGMGRELSDRVRLGTIELIKSVLMYKASEGIVVLLSLPNDKTMRAADQPVSVGTPLREPRR